MTDDTQDLYEAWLDGHIAHSDGLLLINNPYNVTDPRHSEWQDGWTLAEANDTIDFGEDAPEDLEKESDK